MSSVISKLRYGNLRSIGQANDVAKKVLESHALLGQLFEGMLHSDPVVRAQAADAFEKVSVKRPDWMRPYRSRLLSDVAAVDQKEVQWHVAQMLGRAPLTPKQCVKAAKIPRGYLNVRDSQIVKVSALQALHDIAQHDLKLQPEVERLVNRALKDGSPSLKARAKKLKKNGF